MDALKTVKATIAENSLIESGDSILVALSGGPDSVALLHLLSRLTRTLRLRLSAVYVNHQIRKQAAAREEVFCRKLCDKLNVPLYIVRENIPDLARKQRKSVEQAARDFRYGTFENLVGQHGFDRIAVGHHVDDRVETVLFRILRGTGRTGLQGIPVKRGRIIRPLYDLTKADILGYLRGHKLKYCLDQSNASVDYSRNYIRNRLLVDIRKNLNPGVDGALLNVAETVAEDEAFLKDYVARVARRIVTTTPGGKFELDLKKFNSYDKWLRRRLLRYCVAELSTPGNMIDKITVDRLDQLRLPGTKARSIPGGLQAVSTGEMLVIYRRGKTGFIETLTEGEMCRLKVLNLAFRVSVLSRGKEALPDARRPSAVRLDLDKLTGPLTVRSIKPGDRFSPLGLKGSKKVGDYLTDRKVHPVYRDEIPVICDRKGIVWLVGFEIADRAKIDDSTREVMRIEAIRRSKR